MAHLEFTFSAVVVLFDPPSNWADSLAHLTVPPTEILIVANGHAAVDSSRSAPSGAVLVEHPENGGVVAAYAESLARTKSEWLLFLDQDSTPGVDYIERMREVLDRFRSDTSNQTLSVGVITSTIIEKHLGRSTARPNKARAGDLQVRSPPQFINSGTLFSVEALRSVGGAWDRLFVDLVDGELAIRLHDAGFRELHAPKAQLFHELGKVSAHTLFGRQVHATNHSPERRRSIARATFLIVRRHGLRKPGSRIVIRNALGNLVAMLLFERKRPRKMFAILSGACAGFREPLVTTSNP